MTPTRWTWWVLTTLLYTGARVHAADGPRPIRLGETVRAEMPAGDPETRSVPFEFVAEVEGPVTVDVRTLHFVAKLRCFRRAEGGSREKAFEQREGIGRNGRLGGEAEAGTRYEIEVLPSLDDWGGPFELSISPGIAPPLDPAEQRAADLAHWNDVEEEGRRTGDGILLARAAMGRGRVLVETKKDQEARPQYESAHTLFEEVIGADHLRTTEVKMDLAVLLERTGARDEARVLAESALELREKRFGPDHPAVADALTCLATVRQHASSGETVQDAASLYERAIAIQEARFDRDDPRIGRTRKGLLDALVWLGSYDEARKVAERWLAIDEEFFGPEHEQVAHSLNNLGRVLWWMGLYEEARVHLERELQIQEERLGKDHPVVARALARVAVVIGNLGEYAEAKALHERAIEIAETERGPDDPLVALRLNNFAAMLLEMGSYQEAELLFRRALSIQDKTGDPGGNTPMVLGNLATVLYELGSYDDARKHAERGLAIDGGNTRILGTLARIHEATGSRAEAVTLTERALRLTEEHIGPDHPNLSGGLLQLASLREASGAHLEAKVLTERALAIREGRFGAEHPLVAHAHVRLARILLDLGEGASALDAALRAESVGSAHLRLVVQGMAEAQALRYASARPSGLDLALSLAARGTGAETARAVWDALVRSRALVLDEMAARRGLTEVDPDLVQLRNEWAKATTRLANLLVRGPADLSPEIYRRVLDGAREERERAEEALAAKSARFRLQRERGRVGFQDVASGLPAGSSLVAYARYLDHDMAGAASYLALVLSAPTAPPVVVPLGPAGKVDQLIEQWRDRSGAELAAVRAGAAEAAAFTAGSSLRAAVWDPVLPHLPQAARVFVVPDGALHSINIGALPSPSGGYLIERELLLHYLSTERDLVSYDERESRGQGLLAMGNPAYDEASLFVALRGGQHQLAGAPATDSTLIAALRPFRGARSECGDLHVIRFGALPASGREAQQVASLWRKSLRTDPPRKTAGAIEITGPAATESAFKAQAAGRRVLHLATHGFFLGERCPSALDRSRGMGKLAVDEDESVPPARGESPLLLSGLALAGANHRSSAGPDEDDGILTAEEIAALDLSGVEWAVLSACDTGVGEVRAGEGVFGLRRAFQIAGARTVIMSLWSVEDESTRAWMRALYEARLAKGMTTAEAVREASLTVLRARRAHGESTHPFYWAGFVAAGDWR